MEAAVSADLLSHVERPDLPHVTRGEPTPEWRRQHLDAASWPAACGYDPALEPIQLFAQITGVDALTEADELGAVLEAGLRVLAARRLRREVVASPTFLHPRHEWCTAAPHGLCDDGSGLLVAAQFLDDSQFDAPMIVEDWGHREQDVPARILVRATGTMTVVRAWQMTHMPSTTPMSCIHVAALVGGEMRMFFVAWDEELARRLFDRVARFWAGAKVEQPPPPRDTEAFYAYLQKKYPQHEPTKWVDADETLTESVVGWSRIDEQIQRLKRDRHAAKNEICDRIRGAEGIRGVDENGTPWRLPWRSARGPRTLNKALLDTTLRHLLGDAETDRIIEMCTRQGEGYRKLGPKWQPKKKTTIEETRAAVLADDEARNE